MNSQTALKFPVTYLLASGRSNMKGYHEREAISLVKY